MKNKKIFIFSIALCVVASPIEAQQQEIPELQSPIFERRQATYKAIIQNRLNVINDLIELFKTSKDNSFNGTKHMCVALLGQLRAKEAIAVLSQNLMFIPTGYTTDELQDAESSYVCAAALIQIYSPSRSVDFLIDTLSLSNDKKEREIASWVIIGIQGQEQAEQSVSREVQSISQKAVKSEGESKQQLQAAQQRLEDAGLYIKSYSSKIIFPPLPKAQLQNIVPE